MSLIQDLRITTLADNLVQIGGIGQGGLSFLLELTDAKGDSRKLIFDTSDNREALMHNIKRLKADLSDVDCIVLSHGHHDHTAATVEVVAAAGGGVKIHAHPHTFLQRFFESKKGRRREIGVPNEEGLEEIEKVGGKVLLTAKPTEVIPGVWTTGQVERMTTFEHVLSLSEKERLIIIVDGEEIEDRILDDQALWMDVNGNGPFVVTGCAHAGLLNTLLQVKRIGHFSKIQGLVGGTHLVWRSEKYLEQTIGELKEFELGLISPCHCTGFKAMAKLWQAFPDAFVLNFCCRVIEAGKEPERRVI